MYLIKKVIYSLIFNSTLLIMLLVGIQNSGDKNKVNFAIEEADIFVTYTDYEIPDSVVKTKIENFYIYYFKSLD